MVPSAIAKSLGLKTSSSGSWLDDFLDRLSRDNSIELAIFTYSNIQSKIMAETNNVKCYIFPGGGKKLLFYSKTVKIELQNVIESFQPDLIHLHGTEYSMGYALSKINTTTPKLLTIQGILNEIYPNTYGGLDFFTLFRMQSFYELTHLNGAIFLKLMF